MQQLIAALIGLVAVLLLFALLRLRGAARHGRRRQEMGGNLMTSALGDAVTKAKAQERATQERADAADRLSSEILSNFTSGLLVVSSNGDVRILNPAGRRMLGLVEPEVGGTYRDVLGAGSPLAATIDDCLTSGQAIARRRVTLSPPGPPQIAARSLGVSVSPMRSTEGLLQGAICLFTDLTAVMALEEQLRLRESLAALGELTAGLAHEFRNGLATIHGYGRLLDPARVPEVYRPYVEGIRQETKALGEIVTSFVNFARPPDLAVADVELSAVCERAVEDVAEIRPRGAEVTIRGDFGDVQGDEVLLRQAFSNLCRNALEACAGHGVVPHVLIEGRIDSSQRQAHVSVSDNGPGLNPQTVDRIFRPFFTTKPSGTGLGLALVQKIIVTHNGRITAHSSPGGGARFEVWLPLANRKSATPD